jgi:hypothetical protein
MGLEDEPALVVGPVPTATTLMESAGEGGLVFGTPPLGLHPETPLAELGEGVGGCPVDEIVLPARIDLGRLGDEGGPLGGQHA